jgi:hypothetical protein
MAKQLTPSEIAAALVSMGLDVPADLAEKAQNEASDAVEIYLTERMSETDEKKKVSAAESWRLEIFDLAERFAETFTGQEKNVGQGRVFETFVSIDLPDGSNFVLRHREPREKK